MNNDYNNERLTELYEALLRAGNFETKEELFKLLLKFNDEIRIIFNEIK